MVRRVLIETFGCQMNVADSELIQGILQDSGYQAAASLEDADVVLLNTCAVRERAEERIFGRLSNLVSWKRQRPGAQLGVAGCMAERMRHSVMERAPYVDFVIGPDSYRRLAEVLERSQTRPVTDVQLDRHEMYEGLTPVQTQNVCGWVTIQRGCDKFCTFCVVPFVRGRERAVGPAEVLRHVERLVARGVTTVTLLGQTVNSYLHEGVDFAELLKRVAAVEGIQRIRFTSPYPRKFTEELIDVIAAEEKVSKALHLPLQSGSDRVLGLMRRQHTVQEYRELVSKIRCRVEGCALSTDIIVGFPGETEEDYRATVGCIQEFRFDAAFLFNYSEREGTYAARKLVDDVSPQEKGRRLTELIAIQEEISRLAYEARIGTTQAVIVEGSTRRDETRMMGNTDDFKTTMFPGQGYRVGDLIEVKIVGATSHTLLGEPIRVLVPSAVPITLVDSLTEGISLGASAPAHG